MYNLSPTVYPDPPVLTLTSYVGIPVDLVISNVALIPELLTSMPLTFSNRASFKPLVPSDLTEIIPPTASISFTVSVTSPLVPSIPSSFPIETEAPKFSPCACLGLLNYFVISIGRLNTHKCQHHLV